MTEPRPDYTLDTIDLKQVAEELADATLPPLRKPRDVTVADYLRAAARRGIVMNYRQAEYRLSRMVDAGEMRRMRVWDDVAKRECVIYRQLTAAPEAPVDAR